ncbi:Aste57867_15444 [Aphanomyces stellatus]|uniref:Aste57867_15444 protein n=1 Tax=Aphanomyces stellatus TaxID=120398 RepID=A0A485L3Q3_9STRA|nr:hypothetical protein As57867_015388 [Aphanomyces stellatus]VFT92246.1 Aste57867_15444 [Aphanomyces stellatus]
MGDARMTHDTRSTVDVINDLLYEGKAGGRCTFACQTQFNASVAAAHSSHGTTMLARARRHDSTAAAAPAAHPSFRTTFKTPLQLDLKIDSAAKNVAGAATYAPPSLFEYREDNVRARVSNHDFIAKFTVPSNQDERRTVARNQEGFLSGASIKNITCDRYDPRADGKPDFHLQLPHTSSKTGNLTLRQHVTLDQAGLFGGGQAIRDHTYRADDRGAANDDTDARFVLEFKPTGKGYGCVDMGSKARPEGNDA